MTSWRWHRTSLFLVAASRPATCASLVHAPADKLAHGSQTSLSMCAEPVLRSKAIKKRTRSPSIHVWRVVMLTTALAPRPTTTADWKAIGTRVDALGAARSLSSAGQD